MSAGPNDDTICQSGPVVGYDSDLKFPAMNHTVISCWTIQHLGDEGVVIVMKKAH